MRSCRQRDASQRFSAAYKSKTEAEADQPIFDRYQAEVARNTGEVLALVRANPNDPAVVEALKFVIETALRGPGDESYQAMEILLRAHVRDPGMGDVCGRIFHFRHAPVAESLLRAVMETHPNRDDRGLACHTLAWYLEMRAEMVRKIRRGRRRSTTTSTSRSGRQPSGSSRSRIRRPWIVNPRHYANG